MSGAPAGRMVLRPRGRLRLGRIDGRLSVAVVVLLVVMSLFAVRLFQVQVLDNAKYGGAALANRLRPVTLPAARGEITDDTGAPLATTVSAYDITADPTVTGPHAAALAAVLAGPLGLTVAAATSLLTPRAADPKNQYVVLARQLTPQKRDEVDRLLAGLATKLNTGSGAPVGGVYADPDPKRVYPAGNVAGNVVGFLGTVGTKVAGVAGLEQQADGLLAGRDGSSVYEVGADGIHQIPAGVDRTTAAVQGTSIRLTLDQDLQYYAQSEVAAAVARSRAQSGMAIVLDIRTMQVKAMVSVPTVDPSDPGSVSAANRYDNAVSFNYEPGSVEKLLTMATLFDQQKATPLTPVTVPSQLKVANGVTIQDDEAHGTEHLTAAGVVAKSSNIGAAVLSARLSNATLRRYLASFGYGSPTGIGLPNEGPGILPPLEDWANDYTKPEIAYGQSVSVTALQMAAAVASIYNGGVYRAPSLIAGTTSNGTFTPAAAPPAHRVISPLAAAEVVNETEMVTQDGGTAPHAAIPGYIVGGKTGTAQYSDPRCGCYRGYTTSFIGTAPADKPQYLVYVVIQKPTRGSQTGVATAMPAWRAIMTYLLATEHIPPTGARPARLPLYSAGG